ncbi:DoxX family membrane protein [Streptomyces cocklensis]|uniref:Membrane protein, distant similarity to thiosulphate:quinone oxidoreductase DoxD n=1 Tax=Actinacidiphila cocklensis TaxID=887465 RepID=A0A9W4GNE7_9ACTN|nr:DoxX family membrane protein [Actinacidiphila cocklensis]MDD1062021.1 DoxX family membrane protein [Actinacidiphila cocklensis]CAG6391182.1 Membrane protein, distant similarity to thiosulphate:quinone oxidoreductase DoxD [Actinacidiphila cocklensis]
MPFSHRKDLGLLALRLGTGGVLIAHGTQKLLGWFGGGGLEGTTAAMESMGFTPGRESAIAAGLGEAGGGALLALGLATPVAGAAAAGAMAGAVAVHAPAGFFAHKGGFEYPAFLGFVAAGLGLAGPGCYSLDHLAGHRLNRPGTVLLAFAVSAAAATVVVNRRAAALAAAEQDKEPEAEPGGDGRSPSA